LIRVAAPVVYGLADGTDIGGELYERMLVQRLPEHGIAQRLGLPRDHRLSPLPAGTIAELPGHASGAHWLGLPRAFVPWTVRLLRAGEVDVLRGHSVRGCGPSLLLARRLAGVRVPVVLHHHHFFPRWRRLEAAILGAVDAVVTVSEHSRAELTAAGVPAERIHLARNGVQGPAQRIRRAEPWPGGLRLLYLGRLEARKRPDLALATLAGLRAAGIDASLVLAGDGPQREDLAGQAAAGGLELHARFLGRVSDARKWELYDSADLLLFGSALEGFGLVVAEAQSRGLAVIAAAGTATAEALLDGESGLICPPTPAAFTAAARELAEDPERRSAMGRRAAEFAGRFSWERCAAEVAEVLRAAAEVSGS
jgi:glycosyltransferase involved in cell wall biosynthesis